LSTIISNIIVVVKDREREYDILMTNIYKADQCAYVDYKGMLVQVKIIEVKSSYGRIRYVVSPIAGKGTAVVENLIDKPQKLSTDKKSPE